MKSRSIDAALLYLSLIVASIAGCKKNKKVEGSTKVEIGMTNASKLNVGLVTLQ